MNVNELIGKRCLMNGATRFSRNSVEEYNVMEVSPSGNWMRLMNTHGTKFWKPVTDMGLVEVLKQIEPCPAKEA